MPFDWYHPRIPEARKANGSDKFDEMFLDEIRKRARLFKNLGYDRDHAIRRITRNLEWEFEMRSLPAAARQVQAVVDKIYGR